jgi:hypothetical protein
MARKRDTIPRPEVFRQSLLGGFEVCPRRTRFALQAPDDLALGWVESTGDLGTAFHSVAAAILRTMHQHGEDTIPHEEAIVIMREVYAAGDIILPTEDRHTLRQLVLRFVAIPFPANRIAIGANGEPAIEQRLTLEVHCPDGEVRTLKGQPDLIMIDPPDGLMVFDWKSGKGQPKKPRDPLKVIKSEDTGNELAIGKEYLSDRGHFQLDTYGLLALMGKLDDGTMLSPGARRVTLRELHLRSGQVRQATLTIEEVKEHVLQQIADHLMKIDRAISEGPKSKLWKPRGGSHCLKQCPVSRSCPVPPEQRGIGALSTQAQADREAQIFAVWEGKSAQARERLKAWQEANNPPGRVNGRTSAKRSAGGLTRKPSTVKGGGRGFKIWPAAYRANGNGASDVGLHGS